MAYNPNVKSERKDPFEASKESKIAPGTPIILVKMNKKEYIQKVKLKDLIILIKVNQEQVNKILMMRN